MILCIFVFTSALFLIGFGYLYWMVLTSLKPDAKVLFESAFSSHTSQVHSLQSGAYSTVFGSGLDHLQTSGLLGTQECCSA